MTTRIATHQGTYEAPVFGVFTVYGAKYAVTPSARWYHQARLTSIMEETCEYFEVTHVASGRRLPLKKTPRSVEEAVRKGRALLYRRGRKRVKAAMAELTPTA